MSEIETAKVPGLRKATFDDAPALSRLINLAFQKESFFKKGDRTNEQQVRDKFLTDDFYVIDLAEAIIGCVYLEVAQPDNPAVIAAGEDAGYVGMLAVDPAQQGRGLGRKLMAFAEADLLRRGCKRVQLRIINLRTELKTFYRNIGYRETGTSPYPFAEKTIQPTHFINMEKTLSQEV